MKGMRTYWPVAVMTVLLGFGSAVTKANADDRIREALEDRAADFWIYDDLEAAYAKARKTEKPLLVSFRCVP